MKVGESEYRGIWQGDDKASTVMVIDQRRLPFSFDLMELRSVDDVCMAISTMAVRGAPLIGAAAAWGIWLSFLEHRNEKNISVSVHSDAARLRATRPTAVNLAWAVDRVLSSKDPVSEAKRIEKEDLAANLALSRHGASLIQDNDAILTHCNAGFLATAGDYGTALGVIKFAHQQKKKIYVYADETRPRLQGARLTAWELSKEKIPHTLICDDMAGYLMSKKRITKVIVGADRIVAATGSVVNKIGTYSVAVLAKYHNIPFYVAAPYSTIDFSLRSDSEIVIEERSVDEVLVVNGSPISAEKSAFNPSFDITPASLVTAVITEKGILKPGSF